MTCCEITWSLALLQEMLPVAYFVTTKLHIVKNPGFHEGTKHKLKDGIIKAFICFYYINLLIFLC